MKSRTVLHTTLLLALVFCGGCIKQQHNNVQWAKENHVLYAVVEIPAAQWPEYAKAFGVHPESSCFFYPPVLIAVKQGGYITGSVWVAGGEVYFYETNKERCLDHEVGHRREYLERLPYHSTYAK